MPNEFFQADELIGKANLIFANGEETAGFAHIALSEFKLRFYPNEEPRLDAIPRSIESFWDETPTTLRLTLSQPTCDVFFRFDGALLDLNYLQSMFIKRPLEYRFTRCIFGPGAPPDVFDKATFTFMGAKNLIGGERFEVDMERKSIRVDIPPDTLTTGRSRKLGMEIELHNRASWGASLDKPYVRLHRNAYTVARFPKPIGIEGLLDRIHTFITFASLLRGVPTAVTNAKLGRDNDLFALRSKWANPLPDNGDDDEFSENRGILSDAMSHFCRFASYEGKNDAFHTLATVQTQDDWAGWATVALLSVAEGLIDLFENKETRGMRLGRKLKHTAKSVEPYFRKVPGGEWLEEVAAARNDQMHDALNPFRQTRAEVVVARTYALRSMLRAYALQKCEIPSHIIIKALRGSGRVSNFLDLTPNLPK